LELGPSASIILISAKMRAASSAAHSIDRAPRPACGAGSGGIAASKGKEYGKYDDRKRIL
jgi:hypothetical protein